MAVNNLNTWGPQSNVTMKMKDHRTGGGGRLVYRVDHHFESEIKSEWAKQFEVGNIIGVGVIVIPVLLHTLGKNQHHS